MRAHVAPSFCYTGYVSRIPRLSSNGTKRLQACEKQEKCRDAARDLLQEVDDFLSFGYEELELELKERRETQKIVIKIAELITQICNYIVENNKNMFKSFFRMSRSFSPLKSYS